MLEAPTSCGRVGPTIPFDRDHDSSRSNTKPSRSTLTGEARASGIVGLLPRRFPAVPDALQQPPLALGVLLGRVAGVDLSGLSIYNLVRPVCLFNGVGQLLRFPVGVD